MGKLAARACGMVLDLNTVASELVEQTRLHFRIIVSAHDICLLVVVQSQDW